MRNAFHPLLIALLVGLSLTACGDNTPSTPSADEPETLIGKAVKEATDEARKELATENISISRDGQEKAEITPQGDLLIGGKAVAIDDAQRKLLLQYRGHVVGVAEAGIAIGLEGADLAGKAVGAALKGVFTGKPEDAEKQIEAEAQGIEQSAKKLCDLLPGMLDTQNKLAAALPAFKPYASMEQKDVDDCREDGKVNVPGIHIDGNIDVKVDGSAADQAVREEVRTAIRETVRDAVRHEDHSAHNAAEEAEAASVSDTPPKSN